MGLKACLWWNQEACLAFEPRVTSKGQGIALILSSPQGSRRSFGFIQTFELYPYWELVLENEKLLINNI